jgi:membrane-associated phospholipid phosphatase
MSVMLALALAACLAATPAPLKWDPRIDLPVTGVLGAGWLLSEFVFKDALSPDACRWCATNGFDTAVRRAFNPSLMPSASGIRPAATASDLIGFVAVPLAMLGLDALGAKDSPEFWKTWAVDVVLILESTLAAVAVTQVVKFSVGRARPYAVGADEALLAQGRDPADANLSFFSGHSSFTAALAVSTGVIGVLRGYRFAWLTFAVGIPMALATATLRLAADKHWMSDILVGTAIGSAFSVAIPLLFHGREGSPAVRVSPMPNGLALSGTFD